MYQPKFSEPMNRKMGGKRVIHHNSLAIIATKDALGLYWLKKTEGRLNKALKKSNDTVFFSVNSINLWVLHRYLKIYLPGWHLKQLVFVGHNITP